MPFRWVEHTGELELELEASSERGVFEASFEAMRELLSGNETPDRLEAAAEVTGADRAVLLADWLGELAFLAETRGLVPDRLEWLELTEDRVSGRVQGWAGDPPHLVKGASYHRLSFEQADRGWRARVVLDV